MTLNKNHIDYNHGSNFHSKDAPRIILPFVLQSINVTSALDVGCGTGVWLHCLRDLGVKDLKGIDGIDIKNRQYHGEIDEFSFIDLTKDWDLGRTYDICVCLEVAEHLPQESSSHLIERLCKHSQNILFSAAIPYQYGQGHVNCQWPVYWQTLFNQNGFVCEDTIRPHIWNLNFDEYWYKQNIFIARYQPNIAGTEERLHSVIHPSMSDEWLKSLQHCDELIDNPCKMILQALKKILRKLLC